MPRNDGRSGVLLEKIWRRYREDYRRQFPDAAPPSKRWVSSCWSEKDAQALARWTSDEAHRDKHPKWRIPLRRVPEVCEALGASDKEFDELMFVRLRECFEDQEDFADVETILCWLVPTLLEFSERPVLDSDERAVVAAFNKARDAFPGTSLPKSLGEDERLERLLTSWIRKSAAKGADDLREEDASESAPLSEKDIRARNAVLGDLKRAHRQRPVPSKEKRREMLNQAMYKARVAKRQSVAKMLGIELTRKADRLEVDL